MFQHAVALTLVLLISTLEDDMSTQRNRRWSVRPAHLDRDNKGSFVTNVRCYQFHHDPSFESFLGVDRHSFADLLQRVGPRLSHPQTHALPIPPAMRLSIFLRLGFQAAELQVLCIMYIVRLVQ